MCPNGWGLDSRHREGLGRIQEGGGRLKGRGIGASFAPLLHMTGMTSQMNWELI